MIKEATESETIELRRVFDAPRAVAFKAWTEPQRMQRWMGPHGFTVPVCRIDPRPGGIIHFCMRSPEGQDVWCKGVYREIVAPERIVSTDSFADEAGNLVAPTQYGMSPEWPAEALITMTFEERDGTTTFTLRHALSGAPATEVEQCKGGWSETLDRLAEYLAKEAA